MPFASLAKVPKNLPVFSLIRSDVYI